jgi:YHS domain-containing protein
VTALLIWIVRLIVVLVLIRLVMRALGLTRGPAIPRPRARDVERSGGTLVQDPHCGTYLPKSRALALGSGDDAKYFCSPACRDAYSKNPTPQAPGPKPHATSVR